MRIIGRLSRDRYLHNNKLVERVVFTVLKRQSEGSIKNIIDDPYFEIEQIDFSRYQSGIYELKRVNESYDIESGMVDDWDLVLERIK